MCRTNDCRYCRSTLLSLLNLETLRPRKAWTSLKYTGRVRNPVLVSQDDAGDRIKAFSRTKCQVQAIATQ